jgi:glycosyltransferase involved in cell wall biosynthesis
VSGDRRRVLAIIDTVQVSGPGRQLAATVDVLARMDTELRIVIFARHGTPTRPYQSFLEAAGIAHVVISERQPFDTAPLRQVAAELKRFQPHIVQTHGYKPSAVAYLLRRLGSRFRWVAFFHGATTENLKVRAYHMLDQFLMRAADTVIVMSGRHLRELAARDRDVRLIHNAVLFPAEEGALSRDNREGIAHLLVMGRLSSEKGVDVLLNACGRLVASGLQLHLDVVGDGPDRASLEALAVQLHIAGQVTFHGHQADPKPYYRGADLLIIPSRSEGLPNVLLEAIAHGLPVVSTRVGAVPEVVTDSNVGLLCEIGDVAGMHSAIARALAPTYRVDGVNGRRRVLEDFSLEQRCHRLSVLYQGSTSPSRSSLVSAG